MGTKCGANHLVTKLQLTAKNCHFSGFFREFKGLRFNLSKIQWSILIWKVVRLNGFHIYIYIYNFFNNPVCFRPAQINFIGPLFL
ncbi:hypothetical protein Hdeb2414_s0017g00501611 [Helianthus debilis subsp. tardiflorus]